MSNYIQSIDFSDKDALPTGNPAKLARGADIDTELALIAAAIATKEDSANKNAASGYAGLDSGSRVLKTNLPVAVAYEDEANVFTVNQQLSNTSPTYLFSDTDSGADAKHWQLRATGNSYALSTASDAVPTTPVANFLVLTRSGTTPVTTDIQSTNLQHNGSTVWDAANDGSSSGLDADLLDGQQGSFYQSASNLNAGTLADARVAQSNVTQHQAALAINTDQLSTDIADDASTSFTVGSGDAESIRRFTSASAITITLPSSTPSGWNAGDSMGFIRGGTGTLTFSSAGTIRSPGGSAITVQNGKAVATLHSSGVWELSGNV